MRGLLVGLTLSALVGGCVTTESVRFTPIGSQQAIMRDGRAAIISQHAGVTVVISPVARATQAGMRPTFVAAIHNGTGAPVNFTYADISVVQVAGGRAVKPLHVYTVDELQQEERANQIVGALLIGAAGAAGAAAAANDPNPYRRAWNTGVVAGATSAATADVVAAGEFNIAVLESSMLMDNTILPGEWYGGVFQFQGPAYGGGDDGKAYQITFRLNGVAHTINAAQLPNK